MQQVVVVVELELEPELELELGLGLQVVVVGAVGNVDTADNKLVVVEDPLVAVDIDLVDTDRIVDIGDHNPFADTSFVVDTSFDFVHTSSVDNSVDALIVMLHLAFVDLPSEYR